MEIFKDITGFEGRYQISNLGRIKSVGRIVKNTHGEFFKPEMFLKPYSDKDGYQCVCLRDNKRRSKMMRIHRAVLMAFVGVSDYPKAVAMHLNDNPKDNRLENLQWGTASMNVIDAYNKGRKILPTSSRAVIMCDKVTGEELQRFPSIKSAVLSTKNNGTITNICGVCNGRSKTAFGYKWKYAS